MGYRELLLKNKGVLAGGLVAGAILDAGEAHKEKVFKPDVLQMIPFKPKQVTAPCTLYSIRRKQKNNSTVVNFTHRFHSIIVHCRRTRTALTLFPAESSLHRQQPPS